MFPYKSFPIVVGLLTLGLFSQTAIASSCPTDVTEPQDYDNPYVLDASGESVVAYNCATDFDEDFYEITADQNYRVTIVIESVNGEIFDAVWNTTDGSRGGGYEMAVSQAIFEFEVTDSTETIWFGGPINWTDDFEYTVDVTVEPMMADVWVDNASYENGVFSYEIGTSYEDLVLDQGVELVVQHYIMDRSTGVREFIGRGMAPVNSASFMTAGQSSVYQTAIDLLNLNLSRVSWVEGHEYALVSQIVIRDMNGSSAVAVQSNYDVDTRFVSNFATVDLLYSGGTLTVQ